MGRPGVPGVSDTLHALVEYLSTQTVSIQIEKNTKPLLSQHDFPIADQTTLATQCDLIVVVGGDGSLLSAANLALPHQIPVLGINRGRLGFLTDISPSALVKVGAVIRGHYLSEQRLLVNAVIEDTPTQSHRPALNDVVLLPGDVAHMIEFNIFVNHEFVCRQRADGLIVATPTGSTAYALSGGGPILHPTLSALVLVPMFPHTLSSRPIVVDGNSTVTITICKSNETTPYVSCDGQDRIPVHPGGKITIKKCEQSLTLIHPSDYQYFHTLRKKLGWEKHARRPGTHAKDN